MKSLIVKNLWILLMGVLVVPVYADGSKPPPPPPHQHPHGPGFRGKGPRDAFFSKLTSEERAQIDDLAKKGSKKELCAYMQKLMFKYRPPEIKKMDELSAKYLASKDEKEKAAIKQEIAKYARISFQNRQEFTKNNIARTEKQLERAKKGLENLKKRYQYNEQNADAIVADITEQMCLPPDQRKLPKRESPRHKPQMDH